jgi:hypothetical protein
VAKCRSATGVKSAAHDLALGLACGGRRLGFLDSLVGDGMSFGGTTQFGERIGNDGGFGYRGEHADSGLASYQLVADSIAISRLPSRHR